MKRIALALLAVAALALAGCNQGGTDDNYGTDSGAGSIRTNNPPPAQPATPPSQNQNPGG